MAISYPEEKVQDESGTIQRLIDDAFGKICFAVQDLSVQVRELSVKLIGSMHKKTFTFNFWATQRPRITAECTISKFLKKNVPTW